MKEVESDFGPGLIGVPSGSLARYHGTYVSIDQLHVPKGSDFLVAEGVNVAHNCNNLIKSMKPEHEWLFILGDDHRFRSDLLLNLLKHRVDIVVPVVPRRGYPFQTVLYKIASANGKAYLTYAWGDLTREFPDTDLITVEAAGSAGMLIQRHVLQNLAKPHFKWQEKISEDIGFCLDARAKGFTIHADLSQRMTHTTLCELEPYINKAGEWNVAVVIDGLRLSATNIIHNGKDLREIAYGYKEGAGGFEFTTHPIEDAGSTP